MSNRNLEILSIQKGQSKIGQYSGDDKWSFIAPDIRVSVEKKHLIDSNRMKMTVQHLSATRHFHHQQTTTATMTAAKLIIIIKSKFVKICNLWGTNAQPHTTDWNLNNPNQFRRRKQTNKIREEKKNNWSQSRIERHTSNIKRCNKLGNRPQAQWKPTLWIFEINQ